MAELGKIIRVLKKLDPAAPHECLLVLDATVGQNAIQQVDTFRALVQGQALPPLRSRKGQWLLALLALNAGKEVSRERLAQLFWPDSEPGPALFNLRQCLSHLRQAVGAEASLPPFPRRASSSAVRGHSTREPSHPNGM